MFAARGFTIPDREKRIPRVDFTIPDREKPIPHVGFTIPDQETPISRLHFTIPDQEAKSSRARIDGVRSTMREHGSAAQSVQTEPKKGRGSDDSYPTEVSPPGTSDER